MVAKAFLKKMELLSHTGLAESHSSGGLVHEGLMKSGHVLNVAKTNIVDLTRK